MIFLLVMSWFGTSAQELEIGIMRSHKTSAVKITYADGDYEFRSDSAIICSFSKNDKVLLKRRGDLIEISKNDLSLGSYNRIFIVEKKANSHLSLECIAPTAKKIRKHMNNFLVLPESNDALKIINEVEMENYLAGVIESEGGGGKHLEYYKVQAVLSRTYALDHLTKHSKDEFQLCDQVHCQAYHNMMRFTPAIKDAVNLTKGVVMVSKDFKLADAFFFANCGGQTSESDFVWNVSVPYCKSIRDTFCIHSKQARWEKRIDKNTWQDYLIKHFAYPIQDSILGKLIFEFQQPTRTAFFAIPQLGIPLRDLREKFNLKSTWFSCRSENNEVVLSGKGFGHGVGLCQEGAMRMAQFGYSYWQILQFYFTGIQLFDYYDWLFLKQKASDPIF